MILGRILGSKRKKFRSQSNTDTKLPHYALSRVLLEIPVYFIQIFSQYPVLIHLESTFSIYGEKPNYATLLLFI
jgi:hypothetical protein